MQKSLRRGLVLTAIAGTGLIAVAPAALAQPTTQSPEAIAVDVTGLLPIGPIADATEPAHTTETAVGVTVGPTLTPFLSIGDTSDSALTSTVTLNSASSSVDQLSSGLLDISGGVITTTCTANADGSITMNTSVAQLSILGVTVDADTNVAPNDILTGLTLPTGITATVELNRQTLNDPGTGEDTATGLYISVDDSLLGISETIYVSSATCGPFNASEGTPLASGKGLGIGLGLLGLVGTGAGTVYVRRRRFDSAA